MHALNARLPGDDALVKKRPSVCAMDLRPCASVAASDATSSHASTPRLLFHVPTSFFKAPLRFPSRSRTVSQSVCQSDRA